MTNKLRPEFDQARKNYQSERYRGDLADDLGLGGRTSFGPPVWRRFAMAAAVLLGASALWWLVPTNRTESPNSHDESFTIKTIPYLEHSPEPPPENIRPHSLEKIRPYLREWQPGPGEHIQLSPEAREQLKEIYRSLEPRKNEASIRVGLTATPRRADFGGPPRRLSFDVPKRPHSLGRGLTPQRFPGVRFKSFASPNSRP